jgi:hypothetical protein
MNNPDHMLTQIATPETSEQMLHKAAMQVLAQATDRDDAVDLLDMLGLRNALSPNTDRTLVQGDAA